jgi:hypothetical protein
MKMNLKIIRYVLINILISALVPALVNAQLDPENSQVVSYLPQLADGGPASQKWITSFTFTNPNQQSTAIVILEIYGSNGQPLALNLGTGANSQFQFTLGPGATTTLTSAGSSPNTQTGWALALSSLPLQTVVQYRFYVNGVPKQGVSVPSIAASDEFLSPATSNSGIAIVNPHSSGSASITVSVIGASGSVLSNAQITLSPLSQHVFNLNQMFPSLGSGFRGTVKLTGATAQTYFAALIISGDGGVISSYPAAGRAWPVSQYERMWRIWWKVVNAAMSLPATQLTNPPSLVVDYNNQVLNSYACGWVTSLCGSQDINSVHIFFNIAELTSDSDSELAAVMAHELGHIIQAHGSGTGPTYVLWIPQDIEWDADQWGTWLTVLAGFDPYGITGMLGRLYTIGGALLAPNFDGLNDPHGSLLQREGVLWSNIQAVCNLPQMQSACAAYKSAFHPYVPRPAPLDIHATKE